MPNKDTTPLSLYGNDREYLREQEKTNELLADIAGEEYESPGDIPKGKYIVQKRLLDAAQKKNELLESIAEGGGGSGTGSIKGLNIDYSTDVISLKNKSGETIDGSGATLPAYGLNYNSATGGLTLTKNGTAVQGQTVSLPDYGSPLTATSTAGMTDTSKVYVNTTDGKWYYYDGSAWTAGGIYNSQGIDTDTTLLVSGAPADAKATGDAVSDLKTQIDDVIIYPNLVNPAEITPGRYMPPDSTSHANDTYDYTGLIPVVPGETLYVSPRGRYLQARNENNQRVDAAGVSGNFTEYTVPEGIAGVYITFYHNQSDTFMVSKYPGLEYVPYGEKFINTEYIPGFSDLEDDVDNNTSEIQRIKNEREKRNYIRESADLQSGDYLLINKRMPVKNAIILQFSGNITDPFTGIEFGYTNNINQADNTHFKIDATKFYRVTSNPTETDHNLTISGNISITITQTFTHLLIDITCNGAKYHSGNGWVALNAMPYVKVLSPMTDCVFSWTTEKNRKDIIIFGDSYVSYGEKRWVYYLDNDRKDIDNVIISGYHGEQSNQGYVNFTDIMPYISPVYVIWAYGMNDADTGGVVNPDWKEKIDAVIQYCENHDIIPVLCTIPNVPTLDNSRKNNYVRSFAGTYPVIDFAAAVGSDITSAWYSGLLDTDGVHPTEAGAMALYNRAIADFPQLCVK